MTSPTHAAPELPPVIVIGASLGGVQALMQLVAALPAGLPAVVAIVLHVGDQPSILPQLLARRSALPVLHPQDGQPWAPGTVYVAPPDRHLLLTAQGVRLSHGPRENHARPAIDPLFRTAALVWRERAIGVVLTGHLDDGTAGLAAIKDHGGLAVVQDPREALAPSMPASVLASVAVDHCLPLAQIGPLLVQLVGQAQQRSPAQPQPVWAREQAIFEGVGTMDHLAEIGAPSLLTCPDCGGGLTEVKESAPLRYRCHIGHAFTAQTLQHEQAQTQAHALQASLRSLREREILLRRLALVAEGTGDTAQASVGRRQADRVREQARRIAEIIEAEAGVE